MNKPSLDKARAALPGATAALAPVLLALRGRKTYLGASLAAALAAYYLSTGEADRAVELIALALGLAGLRGAVGRANEAPAVVPDAAAGAGYDASPSVTSWVGGGSGVSAHAVPTGEERTPEGFLAGQGPPVYPQFKGLVDPMALDPARLRPPRPAAPDRSLQKDLERFEGEGGPPAKDPERTGPGRPTRGDMAQEDVDRAARDFARGAISVNQARRMVGLDPLPPRESLPKQEDFLTIPEVRRLYGLDGPPDAEETDR